MENMNVYTIKNDVEADNFLCEIRELQSDRDRLEAIFKAKVEELKQSFERQVSGIDKDMEFKKGMLQAYFLTVKPKETKTQKTYKLLSGKLIMKLPTAKLEHDDTKILEYFKGKGNESYYELYTKQIPKLDWTKLKEDLIVKDGVIVNIDGEILDIEGLKLEHIGEKFEIKE